MIKRPLALIRPSERFFKALTLLDVRTHLLAKWSGDLSVKANDKKHFHFRWRGTCVSLALYDVFTLHLLSIQNADSPPGGMTTIAAIERHERREEILGHSTPAELVISPP